MTLSDTTTDTVSLTTATSVSAADLAESAPPRADRREPAGTAGGQRIDSRRDSAHLTYTVTGQGVGAVASTLRAGRHEFAVDEPAALAGDDLAASPVEVALGALISCQV